MNLEGGYMSDLHTNDNTTNNLIKNISLNSNNSNTSNNSFENSNFEMPDMETMMKIMKIINSMNSSENNASTNLLYSLKPFLRDSKKDKIVFKFS